MLLWACFRASAGRLPQPGQPLELVLPALLLVDELRDVDGVGLRVAQLPQVLAHRVDVGVDEDLLTAPSRSSSTPTSTRCARTCGSWATRRPTPSTSRSSSTSSSAGRTSSSG